MLNRIKKVIADSGLSHGDFADRMGINRASLSHVLSGRNKASLDFIIKLVEAFPQTNLEWLVFGRSQAPAAPEAAAPASVVKDEPPTAYVPSRPRSAIPPDGTAAVTERIVVFYSDGTFKTYRPA